MADITTVITRSLILVATFTSSCSGVKAPESSVKSFPDAIVNFSLERLRGEVIELPEVYGSAPIRVLEDSEEHLVLVGVLKKRGFKIAGWGRGNLDARGPRIVTFTLRKDSCECQVDKIYYSTIDTTLIASERIRCYEKQ